MGKIEAPITGLESFLPPGTFRYVAPFFREYPIHLSITRDRASVLGDYRAPHGRQGYHRISINGGLNPYSFLITLLHELAHMLAYIKHKRSILPHGPEWKAIFADLLAAHLGKSVFPDDIEAVLLRSSKRIKASTCTDPELYRVLKKYDTRSPDACLVEEVPMDAHFSTKDGRVFLKIEKLRTRFRCKEVDTGHVYLFPALTEVRLWAPS